MDGHEPDVVVRRELEERPALAERLERAVRLDGAGVPLRILVAHERRRVVGRHVDRTPPVAATAHEDRRVGRPFALVLVQLERPVHLHLVRLHPVHLHVPRAVLRGTERIDVVVLGAVRILSLVLVVVVAPVVRSRHVRRPGAKPGDVVAAPVRPEGESDLALQSVHLRTAHLHHLHVEETVERARVVVGHHGLPLQLSVGVERLGGGIDVESAHDLVRDDHRNAAGGVRDASVADRQDLVVSEELHELSGEVDAGGVVRVVRPVDAPGAP